MNREWKAGDVASIEDARGARHRALVVGGCTHPEHATTTHFHYANGRWASASDPILLKTRNLVVIDPENTDHLDGLCKSLVEAMAVTGWTQAAAVGVHPSTLRTALREFANPTPPRIEEPDMWGVVEASCVHSQARRNWVRGGNGNWYPVDNDETAPDDWDSLIDPTLKREGVPA